MHLLLSANERGSPNVNPFSKRKRARGYLSGKVSFEYFGRPVSEPTPFGTVFLESSAVLFSLGYNPSCGEPCRTGSADSKAVALFQKGQSASSCSAPFWNSSLDHFVTLPTRQQFKCDSPESTVLQDRLRINCAADARVLVEIELPAMSGFEQLRVGASRGQVNLPQSPFCAITFVYFRLPS
jgi:hypothetical protein